MTRDPFLRAALIITITAFAAVLYAFFGPWRATILAAVGVAGAAVLAEEWGRRTPPSRDELKDQLRPRQKTDSEGKPQDFERIA